MAETSTRSIRAPTDRWDAVKAASEHRGMDVNTFLNMLMADYLNGDIYVAVKRRAEPGQQVAVTPPAPARPPLAHAPAAVPAGRLDVAREALETVEAETGVSAKQAAFREAAAGVQIGPTRAPIGSRAKRGSRF